MATYTVFKGSNEGKLVKETLPQKNLEEKEVAIKITHSGICATDLHYLHNDMVLGHEGIAIVERVGSAVTKFKE
jgi:D-arabinose 1-dehydrogenase-like Zn-dependent alcohol dehydrogenase